MQKTLNDLLQVADESIRFPHSALEIARSAQLEDATNSDIAALIAQDPAFAAQLLRIVNSAVYSPVNPISALDEAISRVGRSTIVELAWMQSTAAAFNHLESDLMRVTTFWEHCRETAVLSEDLAKQSGLASGDAFAAGLLHDIGLLLLFHACPEEIVRVLDLALEQDLELCASERELFGFDHAEVGAALAAHWQLPDALECAIAFHHDPTRAPRHQPLVACIALANQYSGDGNTDERAVADAMAMLGGGDLASPIAQLVEASTQKAERYKQLAL